MFNYAPLLSVLVVTNLLVLSHDFYVRLAAGAGVLILGCLIFILHAPLRVVDAPNE